jgi:hypothetical protein
MLDRRKVLALALALAFVGLLGLYAYASTITPRVLAIGAIGGDDVGVLVETRGHVRSARTGSGGSVTYDIVDLADFAAIEVFVPARIHEGIENRPLVPGTEVRVRGEVAEFAGRLEIVVARSGDLQVLTPPGEEEVSVEFLARNAPVLAGMTFRTVGHVDDLRVIADPRRVLLRDGDAEVYAFVEEPVAVAASVDVYGRFLYNEERGRWEIKVAAPADALVASPSDPPPGYVEVTLSALLADPAAYADVPVAVRGVAAEAGELIGTAFVLWDVGTLDVFSLRGIVFGWDWASDPRGVAEGDVAAFVGTLAYYEAEAAWQLTAETVTLTPLP